MSASLSPTASPLDPGTVLAPLRHGGPRLPLTPFAPPRPTGLRSEASLYLACPSRRSDVGQAGNQGR